MDTSKLMKELGNSANPARVLRVIKTPAPAVGVDLTIPVPGHSIWRPVSLIATLVTSAVAGSRAPALAITDGTDTLALQGINSTIPANTTSKVAFFGAGNQPSGAAAAALFTNPMPDVVIQGGFTIAFQTALIDVGDQWGASLLWVEEYLEQPFGVDVDRLENWLEFLVRTSQAAQGVS